MPSKTPAQARLMAGVANSPAFAKKVGIPMSVGRDFNSADAGTGILSGPRHGKHLRVIGRLRGPRLPSINPK